MKSMTRREWLGATAFTGACAAAQAQTKPLNVVFFMTDDHGAWATGAYGCKEMHTPNIDRLAREGVLFTRAFAATPVCSPSRLTWFSGKLPSHHGAQDWLRPEDSFGEKSRPYLKPGDSFTEVLARNGYTVGLSGKWHMGSDQQAHAGFTYWNTIPGGGGPYKDVRFLRNGELQPPVDYKTDGVGNGALDFLDLYGKRPFFLYVPFYAPHTPFNYQPEKYRAPYQNADFNCFPEPEMHPWQNSGLAAHHRNEDSQRAYSALVTGLDANVGRVLEKLEQLGVRDNTLVIFSADQGFNCGHHGVWGKGNGTVPFNMYEESIRIPLIWNLPGRLQAGKQVEALVSTYDFYPTILEFLGLTGKGGRERPGRSYGNLLRGEKADRRNRLFFEYSYVRAIRTDNLKLIERTDNWPGELYDLEADPGETRNLWQEPSHRRQREALRSELRGFFKTIGAPPIEQWKSTTSQKLTEYERARPK